MPALLSLLARVVLLTLVAQHSAVSGGGRALLAGRTTVADGERRQLNQRQEHVRTDVLRQLDYQDSTWIESSARYSDHGRQQILTDQLPLGMIPSLDRKHVTVVRNPPTLSQHTFLAHFAWNGSAACEVRVAIWLVTHQVASWSDRVRDVTLLLPINSQSEMTADSLVLTSSFGRRHGRHLAGRLENQAGDNNTSWLSFRLQASRMQRAVCPRTNCSDASDILVEFVIRYLNCTAEVDVATLTSVHKAPLLLVSVLDESRSTAKKRRSRRDACQRPGCCLKIATVTIGDLGLRDRVLLPSAITLTYCAGSCHHEPAVPRLWKKYVRSRQRTPQSCCSPIQTRPVPLDITYATTSVRSTRSAPYITTRTLSIEEVVDCGCN